MKHELDFLLKERGRIGRSVVLFAYHLDAFVRLSQGRIENLT